MSEKTFNPNEHLLNLKGKDYLQVMWRLVWFRQDKPLWAIKTELLKLEDEQAVFKAIITDETGNIRSEGHGSETKKDFNDYIEKAETKAVGRALAMLGYGTQFAPELDEGERIVDSPVDRKYDTTPPPKRETPKTESKGEYKFKHGQYAGKNLYYVAEHDRRHIEDLIANPKTKPDFVSYLNQFLIEYDNDMANPPNPFIDEKGSAKIGD